MIKRSFLKGQVYLEYIWRPVDNIVMHKSFTKHHNYQSLSSACGSRPIKQSWRSAFARFIHSSNYKANGEGPERWLCKRNESAGAKRATAGFGKQAPKVQMWGS